MRSTGTASHRQRVSQLSGTALGQAARHREWQAAGLYRRDEANCRRRLEGGERGPSTRAGDGGSTPQRGPGVSVPSEGGERGRTRGAEHRHWSSCRRETAR